jgi:hypothetical protein
MYILQVAYLTFPMDGIVSKYLQFTSKRCAGKNNALVYSKRVFDQYQNKSIDVLFEDDFLCNNWQAKLHVIEST